MHFFQPFSTNWKFSPTFSLQWSTPCLYYRYISSWLHQTATMQSCMYNRIQQFSYSRSEYTIYTWLVTHHHKNPHSASKWNSDHLFIHLCAHKCQILFSQTCTWIDLKSVHRFATTNSSLSTCMWMDLNFSSKTCSQVKFWGQFFKKKSVKHKK